MGVEIRDNPEQHRFEAYVDGELAGSAYYRLREDRITFTHTEVDDAHEGQGVGSQLARAALDGAADAGLDVYPSCPFVKEWIRRHPDPYLSLVPEHARASYGLD